LFGKPFKPLISKEFRGSFEYAFKGNLMKKHASRYRKVQKIITYMLWFLLNSPLTERKVHDIISVHSANARQNTGGVFEVFSEKYQKAYFKSGKRPFGQKSKNTIYR